MTGGSGSFHSGIQADKIENTLDIPVHSIRGQKTVFRKVSTLKIMECSSIHDRLDRSSHVGQCNHKGTRMYSEGKRTYNV